MGDIRNAYRILVGKPEGEKPLGRSKHRWKNYIRKGGRMWTGCVWLRNE
jgi:hypothetical protein